MCGAHTEAQWEGIKCTSLSTTDHQNAKTSCFSRRHPLVHFSLMTFGVVCTASAYLSCCWCRPSEGPGSDLRGGDQEQRGGPGSEQTTASGQNRRESEAGGAGCLLDHHPGQGLPTPLQTGPGWRRAEILVPLDWTHVGPLHGPALSTKAQTKQQTNDDFIVSCLVCFSTTVLQSSIRC